MKIETIKVYLKVKEIEAKSLIDVLKKKELTKDERLFFQSKLRTKALYADFLNMCYIEMNRNGFISEETREQLHYLEDSYLLKELEEDVVSDSFLDYCFLSFRLVGA